MALASVLAAPPLYGHVQPRLAPPVPLSSDIDGYRETAADIGVDLMPWQVVAAQHINALAPDGRWLYREVAVVVARQNGKSSLLVPLIVRRLLAGQRIMHTAQNRKLPFEVFEKVAELMWEKHPTMFKTRNGRLMKPRYANGQEEIELINGGVYSIVAPTRGGARGPSRDLLVVDELREMDTYDFMAAAKPTLTVAPNPQTLYLSNAGTDESIVLNDLSNRAGKDPSLAYLEWSAEPDLASDDPIGWAQANPGMGYEREGMGSILETLETEHRSALISGTMTIFETEHLCRRQVTMRPRLVDEVSWARCRALKVDKPRRPVFGISMDPSGTRASVVMAWRQEDKTVAIQELYDVTSEALATDPLGEDAMAMARRLGVMTVGYDDGTDRDLARHFLKKSKAIIGKDFANATEAFVRAVAGNQIRFVDGDHITEDLKSTSRKDNDETGTYYAVKSKDDLPVTAAFAAIRAFWLASGSSPTRPKVY